MGEHARSKRWHVPASAFVLRFYVRHASAVIVLLAVAASSTNARAAPRSTEVVLDYGLGLDAVQIRDDLLRPLRWQGVGGALRVDLDVDAGTLVHDVGVTLGAAALWNRFSDMGFLVSQGLHYGLLARIGRRRPVGVLAGAVYRYESLDGYYADWDDSFLYWFSTHTLAPAVAFEAKPFAATRFWARIELPVIGVMSRPSETHVYKVDPIPYFGRYPELTNRHPVLVGPAEVSAPTVSVRADHSFGRHLGLRLGIDLWYRRAFEPRDFFALGERLVMELRHAF